MAKTITCVEILFSIDDAIEWIQDTIHELTIGGLVVSKSEIQLLPGGGYRAGVILEDNQIDLFGAEQDA